MLSFSNRLSKSVLFLFSYRFWPEVVTHTMEITPDEWPLFVKKRNFTTWNYL